MNRYVDFIADEIIRLENKGFFRNEEDRNNFIRKIVEDHNKQVKRDRIASLIGILLGLIIMAPVIFSVI